MRLVGRAEAEVVEGEQSVSPLMRQLGQQVQGPGHPEDALLAVLGQGEADQQPQPPAQQAAGRRRGLGGARLGQRHLEALQEIVLGDGKREIADWCE